MSSPIDAPSKPSPLAKKRRKLSLQGLPVVSQAVPSRPYLDEILQQDFRYVHPLAGFWEMYHNAEAGPQVPPIVLQSMLFTACSFDSPGMLEELEHASVRSARRALYDQARWPYSFETGHSKLNIAQAALILDAVV
ncbi:hypothetical protein CEP52_010034 [Fusarium oligoseptatum]|uniref:Uncharacterized protein n=1 Tax=Fusarium oligoseptatum TaxID=2604345 RepID=A0A428TA62_9HYPO|nr:hypothetical protein CEP52_010034 [Fusarium oligoseptatum]